MDGTHIISYAFVGMLQLHTFFVQYTLDFVLVTPSAGAKDSVASAFVLGQSIVFTKNL